MANLPSKPWDKAFEEVTDFSHVIVDNGTKKGKKITKATMKDVLAYEGALFDPIAPGATSATATVIPSGPAGVKREWTPAPGYYKVGTTTYNVTADKDWKFYWNGTAWALRDLGPKPDSSSKIGEFSAGTYMKDTVKTVGTTIYRAKVGTSQAPSATATDWEVLGSNLKLDVEGGATSYKKGLVMFDLLDYFVKQGALTKDVSALKTDGLLMKRDNTVYSTSDGNNGSYRDLSVEGYKYLNIEFIETNTTRPELASIIGIKADNTITVIRECPTSPSPLQTLKIDVTGYKTLSINFNRSRAPKLVLEKLESTVVYTDLVKKYIDTVKTYVDGKLGDLDFLSQVIVGYEQKGINGVNPQYNTGGVYVLSKTNTYSSVSSGDNTGLLWMDVPTEGLGDILKLEAIRFGGGTMNSNFNFVGKRKDTGSFEGISGNQNTNPTDIIETFTIDLSVYSSFSISLHNKKSTNVGLSQRVTYNSTGSDRKKLLDVIQDRSELKTYSAAVTLDISIKKTFHIAPAGAIVLSVVNMQQSDYFTLFVAPTANITSLTITGGAVLWQNNQPVNLEVGRAYYITFNTFRKGATWVASVIGAWDNSNSNII